MNIAIISALLYSSAFLFPRYCCWSIYIFLAPLYYQVLQQKNVSVLEGFFWGIITTLICYYDIWLFCIQQGNSGFVALAIIFICIVLLVIPATIWFITIQTCNNLFPHNHIAQIVNFTTATLLYFYYMVHYALRPLHLEQGSWIMSPLVPCASYPMLISLVPYIGIHVVIAICIVVNIAQAHFWYYKKNIYMAWSICIVIITTIPYWIERTQKFPAWVQNLGFLKPQVNQHPYQTAEYLMEHLQQLQAKHRNLHVIIGPESTYPFPCNIYKKCMNMLLQNALCEDTILIMGVQRSEKNKLYNTCCYCKNGRIILTYDKKKLMPLTEYTPKNATIKSIKQLFFGDEKQFDSGNFHQQSLLPMPWGQVRLLMCSEFFLLDKKPHERVPLLVLVNDSWFKHIFSKKLLHLAAILRAVEWSTEIIYVSHSHSTYISPRGYCQNLSSIEL